MRIKLILALASVLLLVSCSPRDFLTRRLAADLIANSATFQSPQRFLLQTGIVSNKDYLAPEYLVLQHRGWISATNAACPPQVAPPPCWDVVLTPTGVDTVRVLVPTEDAERSSLRIPAAKRELIAITGIAKQGNSADVDFTWKWVPLNEFGAAIYPTDLRYQSTVSFRNYDDGWRILQTTPHAPQSLDDALKNAEPAP